MTFVANDLGIPIVWNAMHDFWFNQIVAYSNTDEKLLSVVHSTLDAVRLSKYVQRYPPHQSLEQILTRAGSVWTVTDKGIQRQVEATVQDAFDRATAPQDSPSEQLKEARENAYGRKPDPA